MTQPTTGEEARLWAKFSKLREMRSSAIERFRTSDEQYHDWIFNSFWDFCGAEEYGYDPAKPEALFTQPKGQEYQFEDNLRQTEGAIRILEILKGERKDIIVCRIRTVSLSENPRYEALSYCWGHDNPPCSIGIQSRSINWASRDSRQAPQYDYIHNVTPNLRSALRYLRLPNKSRLIWADSICINQGNTDERNHQVALMHNVYSRADKTLIWLGTALSNSDRVFEDLRRIAYNEKHQTSDVYGNPVLGDSRVRGVSAIARLLDRPWFHRLWPVQEVILAKDAEIICGEEKMPWDDFTRATGIIYDSNLAPDKRATMVDLGWFESYEVLIRAQQEMSRPNRDPFDRLTNLLLMLRRRQCEEPKDKVYGLAALVFSPTGEQIIKANYNLSCQDVYADATQRVIENTHRLDILSASGSFRLHGEGNQLMPSWIGDFDLPEQRPPWSFRFIHGTGVRACRPRLEAHRGDVRFDGAQLVVKAYFLDKIEEVASVLREFDRTLIKKRIERGDKRAEDKECEMQDTIELVNRLKESAGFKSMLRAKYLESIARLRMVKAISLANIATLKTEFVTAWAWYLQAVQTLLDWETFAGLEICTGDRLYPKDTEEDEDSESEEDSSSKPWRVRRRGEYWRTITGGSLLPAPSTSVLPCGAVPPSSSSPEVQASRAAFKRFDEILAISRELRREGIGMEKKVDRLVNFLGST